MTPSQNLLLTPPCLLGADPKPEREPERKPVRSEDDPPTLPIPTREGVPREATLRGVAPTREEIDAYRAARQAKAPQSTLDVSLSELEVVANADEDDVTLCDLTPPLPLESRDGPAAEMDAEWLVTDRSFATTIGAGALALAVALGMVLGRPSAEATAVASPAPELSAATASVPVGAHEAARADATAATLAKPAPSGVSASAQTPLKHTLKASPRPATRAAFARTSPKAQARLKARTRAKLSAHR